MCQVFNVSRSGYYHWLKEPISQREREDMELKQKITEIYYNSRKTYGSPRIHRQLLREGYSIIILTASLPRTDPTSTGWPISPTFTPKKAGFIWQPSWSSSPGRLSAGH